MQDDTGQTSRRRRKVHTYWIDDGRYSGHCFRYDHFLPDTVYAVIWMNVEHQQHFCRGRYLHRFITCDR